MDLPARPLEVLDAGISAGVRAINEAIGEIDAAFAAEMQSRHGVPEWDRTAPMHLQLFDV